MVAVALKWETSAMSSIFQEPNLEGGKGQIGACPRESGRVEYETTSRIANSLRRCHSSVLSNQ